MPEVHGVSDESMKSPRHVGFGRCVDENAGHLIGKIVTGRSVQRPIRTQLFRAAQNFFRDHVNGAIVFR